MTSKGEVYYCRTCNAKVQVLQGGGGILVCCGVEMELLDQGGPSASPSARSAAHKKKR